MAMVAVNQGYRFDNGGPQEVPLVLTQAIGGSCFVTKVEFTNPTVGTITVLAQDGNGVALIPADPLPAGQVVSYVDRDGRRCPGGVWVQADAPGAKVYIRGATAL